MALEQLDLETGLNKEDYAIKLIRDHEPPEGYYLAFSGGKHSIIAEHLTMRSGVRYDSHYCFSPIDPPQVWDFIKTNYPNVQWDYHAKGFWKLVIKNDLPLRQQRWCCRYIKEVGGENRVNIVGNCAYESSNRSHQCFYEPQDHSVKHAHNKTLLRPILKFSEFDTWQYIIKYKLPYCELYDRGYERIGCILCPNNKEVEKHEHDFPKICNLWKLACNHIVEGYKARGYISKRGKPMKFKPKTGDELYQWWIKRK
jgi:phosphoadenosine phosphosulfate reductase